MEPAEQCHREGSSIVSQGMEPTRIIVIGGGLAGLTAAATLSTAVGPSPSSKAPRSSVGGPAAAIATASTSTRAPMPCTAPPGVWSSCAGSASPCGASGRGSIVLGSGSGGAAVPFARYLRRDVGDRFKVVKAMAGLGPSAAAEWTTPTGRRVDRVGDGRRAGAPRAGLTDPYDDVQRRHVDPRRRCRDRPAARRGARCAVPAPRLVEPRRRVGRHRPRQWRDRDDRHAGRCSRTRRPGARRAPRRRPDPAGGRRGRRRERFPPCRRSAQRRRRRRTSAKSLPKPCRCAWPTWTWPCGPCRRAASPHSSASTTPSSSPCRALSPMWRPTAPTSYRSPATFAPVRSTAITGPVSKRSSMSTKPDWRDHVVDVRYVPRSMVAGDHARHATRGHVGASVGRCRRCPWPGGRRRLGRTGGDARRRVDPVGGGCGGVGRHRHAEAREPEPRPQMNERRVRGGSSSAARHRLPAAGEPGGGRGCGRRCRGAMDER